MSEEELIDELVDNKKVIRGTIPEGIFKEMAYTTIVNPYKRLICKCYDDANKKFVYRNNTDFNEYVSLVKIDDYISNKLSMYIEVFERRFKVYVGEMYSNLMKADSADCNDYRLLEKVYNDGLKDYDIYRSLDSNKKKTFSVSTIPSAKAGKLLSVSEFYNDKCKVMKINNDHFCSRIETIKKIINLGTKNGYSSNLLVTHYQRSGKNVPIWVVMRTLTLGEALTLFNLLHKDLRRDFCEFFLGIDKIKSEDIAKVSNKINAIRKIRNTVNHYEPIFPVLYEYKDMNKEGILLSVIERLTYVYKNSNVRSIDITFRDCIPSSSYPIETQYNKNTLKFVKNIVTRL